MMLGTAESATFQQQMSLFPNLTVGGTEGAERERRGGREERNEETGDGEEEGEKERGEEMREERGKGGNRVKTR